MNVTRRSLLSDTETTLDLPITPDHIARWRGGALLEQAFPDLTPYQREFWMTGLTPEEYAAQLDGALDGAPDA
jgi:hypothetical protein